MLYDFAFECLRVYAFECCMLCVMCCMLYVMFRVCNVLCVLCKPIVYVECNVL